MTDTPIIPEADIEAGPQVASIPALLAAQAARVPGREFLRFEGVSYTYGQVETATNRIAHELAGRGIGAGERVAIQLGNEPGWPLTWLACLEAGAIDVALAWNPPGSSTPLHLKLLPPAREDFERAVIHENEIAREAWNRGYIQAGVERFWQARR